MMLNGKLMEQGDAAKVDDLTHVEILSQTGAEIVLFDLPSHKINNSLN